MKKSLKLFLLIVSSIILIITCIGLSITYQLKDVNLIEKKLINLEQKITYFDHTGQVFAEESGDTIITKYENIPSYTKNAFIAIEDKRFYNHNGVDYHGVMRAVFNNVKSLSLKEGASTISQQLIKNTHLSHEKTFKRKLKELKLTKQLERKFSKEEILEKYLNTIYFGGNCYGITAAAMHYFDKTPENLNLNESATLAAIIKAPSLYSPITNYEKCFNRKKLVLKEMFNQNYISKNEYEEIKDLPIEIKTESKTKQYDYIYLAKKEINKILDKSPYSASNINVETEYNKDFDHKINKIIADYSQYDYEKSVVLMKNNGKIISYYSTCGDTNRQFGSTLKPIAVYGPAIDQNLITPYTYLNDEKTDFNGYSPSNYNEKYYGYISVKDSLTQSSNVCSARILNYLGVENSAKYLRKTDLNITDSDLTLTLALGSTLNGGKLTDLTATYNIFSNDGVYTSPSVINQIKTNNDHAIYKNNKKKHKIFSSGTVSIMNEMLNDVVKNGTAKKLNNLNFDIYAKTGTVGNKNGNTDAYIISYTKDYTLGVWFGAKNDTLMPNSVTGGSIPALLALDVWNELYVNYSNTKIEKKDVVEIYLDKISYQTDKEIIIADENAPERYKFSAVFKNDNIPNKTSTRFTKPEIQEPKIIVNNNEIEIKLCQTELYNYFIYQTKNGQKKLVKDTKGDKQIFTDKLLSPGVYEYSVIPYFESSENIFLGKEYFFNKIKSPNIKFGDNWWQNDFE